MLTTTNIHDRKEHRITLYTVIQLKIRFHFAEYNLNKLYSAKWKGALYDAKLTSRSFRSQEVTKHFNALRKTLKTSNLGLQIGMTTLQVGMASLQISMASLQIGMASLQIGMAVLQIRMALFQILKHILQAANAILKN